MNVNISDMDSEHAMLHAAVSLPALRHLGLPPGADVGTYLLALTGLAQLDWLQCYMLSLSEGEAAAAAPVLSQLIRLAAHHWRSLPHDHADSLGCLREVAVGQVCLTALADTAA